MTEPSDEFNKIIGDAVNRRPKDFVSFSNHEDDDGTVQGIIKRIETSGGVKEIWKPILFGIVIDVENYYLDEKLKKQLNTTVQHEQKVTWLATNGATFNYGWNNQKPFRSDIDLRDFPDGFEVHDCIRVEAKGAMVKRIKRVSLNDVKATLQK